MSPNPQAEYRIEVSPEEIAWLAAAISEYLRYAEQAKFKGYLLGFEPLPLEYLEQMDLEQLVSVVGGITDPLGQLKKWFENQFKAIASWFANTVRGIADWFWNNIVKPVLDGISSTVNNIWNWIQEKLPAIEDALKSIGDALKKVVVDPILKAIDWIKENFPKFINAISGLVTAVQNVLSYLGQRIGEIISGITSAVRGVIEDIASVFQKAFGALVNFFKELPSKIASFVSWLSQKFSTIMSAARQFFSTIGDYLSKIPSMLESFFKTAWDYLSKIGSLIVNAFTTASKYLGQLPTLITTALENAGKILSNLGKEIMSALSTVWDFIRSLPQRITTILGPVFDFLSRIGKQIVTTFQTVAKFIGQIPSMISSFFESISSRIQGFLKEIEGLFKPVISFIQNIPKMVGGFLSWISKQISNISKAFGNFITAIQKAISNIPKLVESIVTEIGKNLSGIVTTISKIGESIVKALGPVFQALSKIPETITSALSKIGETISNIGQTISKQFSKIFEFFENLPKKVWSSLQSIFEPISEKLEDIGKIINEIVKSLESFFQPTKFVEAAMTILQKYYPELYKEWENELKKIKEPIDWITHFPEILWLSVRTVAALLWYFMPKPIKDFFDKVAGYLHQVGVNLTGFINAILKFPEWFPKWFEEHISKPIVEGLKSFAKWIWETIPDWLKKAIEGIKDVFSKIADIFNEPQKYLGEFFGWLGKQIWNFASKVWEGLEKAGEAFVNYLSKAAQWLWNAIVSGAKALWQAITGAIEGVAEAIKGFLESLAKRLFFEPLSKLGEKIESIWFSIMSGLHGELSLLFNIGQQFMWEYWHATLMLYLLSGAIESFADFEFKLAPEVLGTKLGGAGIRIKLKDLIDSFFKAIKEFYPNFLLGSMFGLASTILRPVEYIYRAKFVEQYNKKAKELFADVLAQEIKEGAKISVFIEAPTISELKDWFRRIIGMIANKLGGLPIKNGRLAEIPKELLPYWATFKAHLKLRGLPDWYIDYLSDLGQQLVVQFTDRFGATRALWLGELFELPTHSELARMTQRDIFPGVNVMQQVAWVRGWNPDLTTLIYLMTFQYPSFEKLWRFYMRATAGMLWFSPPSTIAQVFAKEAQTIGAGVPISPLELQENLAASGAFDAFELAINTYFKWLAYSNFSWFTDKTEMYGIPIGKEIISKLKGWTADSWILADVAADIPGKIDMRWMSRFGIFLWFAERAEQQGVTFESYSPLVKVIPKILEPSAASPISVDLKWFSKMLQATGLHPAWVPIVTVAENIMVISDEMTLLRTGWLHLFKEGLLTVDIVEKCLSGIITVAYQVGYWDPSSKKWTTAYINLPVRWLPHERRLLELRMLMDRIYDIYREFYGYLRSGIRYLAITPDEAASTMQSVIAILKQHYETLAEKITGKKLPLTLDEDYLSLWKSIEAVAWKIAIKERLRYWWYRVSGWLFYRIAYGYVSVDDVKELINTIAKFVPVTEEEKEAYLSIAEAIIGIVRKEYIPTPSQLATIAEYVPEAVNYINEVLQQRHVPKEWWPIWEKYVKIKPIAGEVKHLMHYYERAKVLGINLGDLEKQILELAKQVGYTEKELEIIRLTIQVEQLIEAVKEYIPTPSQLSVLAEYVEIPESLIKEVFEKRRVPEEWRTIWLRYIEVKPIKSDAKRLLSVMIRAVRYGLITEKEVEDFLKKLSDYGFPSYELELVKKWAELELEIAEYEYARSMYIPTPSMLATLSEYVVIPEKLIMEALQRRRVPQEWISIWLQYIKIRPLADEARALASAYYRALALGVSLGRLGDEVIKILKSLGFTDEELNLRKLRAEIEELIYSRKEYIPTPSMLATIAEYVPWARKLFPEVVKAKRIPSEWIKVWEAYIKVKPIYGEVKSYVSALCRLSEYFILAVGDLKKILSKLTSYGFESTEIELIVSRVELERQYRAYRELIGTPRELVVMAEYSPSARRVALMQVYKMIDALPVDSRTKEFIKKMWEEYIRVKPVYDEVRRYVTELLNDYAYGVIAFDELKKELEALKEWGLDDYEIQFYLWLATRKRERQIKREQERAARYHVHR